MFILKCMCIIILFAVKYIVRTTGGINVKKRRKQIKKERRTLGRALQKGR